MRIGDMILHMAVKVQKQLRRKGSAKPNGNLGFFFGWKSNFWREGNAHMKPIITPKLTKPFFVRKQVTTLEEKRECIAQPKHKQKIRFFQYQGLGIIHMNVQIR